jgi:hypothetical protein
MFGAVILVVTQITVAAQSQPAARARFSGTVTSVTAGRNELTLKGDNGDDVSVTTTDRTVLLRIPPGETDPKKGRAIVFSEVNTGDRAVIIGPPPDDPKARIATTVLVMSKSDVAELQQRDQDDWKKRGVTGTVTAIDPAAKIVTLAIGSRTLAVQVSDRTSFQRYSLDSARFADAKPSSLAEIKSGDQVRVLGNRGNDGVIRGEKIVSGSFRQIAATITAIDLERHELTVKDLASKKPLIIKIDTDSEMRKLPEPAARMLARRYTPVAQPGAGAGGRQGGSPGGDIGQMLDHLPALPISDLKAGDAILVSATRGTNPGRVTAITLLAGVEPLLTASPTATRDIMSGWNLGGGGDSGQ